MGKTKPFSFRISNDLYDSVKKLADFFNLSLSDLVERLLIYFKHNPHEIVDLKIKKTIAAQKEQEVLQLQQNPMEGISSIRKTGIETFGQLCWIASLMQQAWSRSSGTVTAPWVTNVAKAIKLLLQTKIANIGELNPYLLTTYPITTPEDLSSTSLIKKVDNSITAMLKIERIDKFHADQIARCFEVLIRDGEFDISQELLNSIKHLLEPWCFWVAKRAIVRKPFGREIDTALLLNQTTPRRHDILLPENTHGTDPVRMEIFMPPFPASDEVFSCGFDFMNSEKLTFTIACTSITYYELIEAINILERNKVIVDYGAWQLMKEEKQGAYTIRKDSVLIFVDKKEFESFIKLAKDAYNIEDVKRAIEFSLAEKYGAV
ncbi:MAG: hypothetical protein K8I29_01590 [Alphaproteobacteria bacterium]|uniref:Uncharacterized protein n=1 Tax=Candidatus Nitrobium versatile TaxID=2884831 RepID=A0A953LVI1_9BACT|nr:hypothetical protein [Candidatus Nitrobium versatile]